MLTNLKLPDAPDESRAADNAHKLYTLITFTTSLSSLLDKIVIKLINQIVQGINCTYRIVKVQCKFTLQIISDTFAIK